MIAHIFILASMLFYGNACNESTAEKKVKGKGYSITGQIHNADATTIYLEEISKTKRVVIDTGTLKKNGSFKLEGFVAERGFYQLRFGNNKIVPMVLANTKIKFEINANQIEQYEVKGSHETEILRDLNNSVNATYLAAKEFQSQLMAARRSSKFDSLNRSIQRQYQDMMEVQTNNIKILIDTTSSIVAIYAANVLNPEQEMVYLKSLISKFQKRFPESKHSKLFADRINAMRKLAVGEPVPDITLKTPEGTSLSLSSLRGKIVLLDFWAAWCRPCRMENPNVVRLYQKYKNKGFEVFSVSLDKTKRQWTSAIAKDNLIWKSHVSDLKGWQSSAAKTYKVNSIPNTFLIDREGNMIAKNLRGYALASKLQELLGE